MMIMMVMIDVFYGTGSALDHISHYNPSSNLGVGISDGCFIFDFATLPLEVARPI